MDKVKKGCENCSYFIKSDDGVVLCNNDKGRIHRMLSDDVCVEYDTNRSTAMYILTVVILYAIMMACIVITIKNI